MSARMDEQKWDRRERKVRRRKFGMKMSGASVRILDRIIRERAKRVEKPDSEER